MPGGKRLTARFVETAKRPGRYTDGPGGLGLSLRVQARASGGVAKNWSQRIRIAGRYRYLGLGSYPVITLKMARDRALRNARTVAEGGDPMRPPTPTLAEALEEVLALRRPTWKAGASTEKIWRSAFQYVLPALGQKPVDRITTGDLMECLNPI
ncbi:MAG: Arm DNA-binding domain-containing protein, partial [bacterium]|nr:Arm DNA-binding domain-containing protein [bacterium]